MKWSLTLEFRNIDRLSSDYVNVEDRGIIVRAVAQLEQKPTRIFTNPSPSKKFLVQYEFPESTELEAELKTHEIIDGIKSQIENKKNLCI